MVLKIWATVAWSHAVMLYQGNYLWCGGEKNSLMSRFLAEKLDGRFDSLGRSVSGCNVNC